ncbi:MAG: DUF1638 domain-containing protein [Acidimicrobiales bacterium]
MATPDRGVCVVACGALAAELVALKAKHHLTDLTIECLPATLHNRPERIADAVAAKVTEVSERFERVLVGYADCGTGGRLDRVCAELGVERIEGAHCYEFFAGADQFAELSADEPGTFYLTDFLALNFDTLVWRGLGLDRHGELLDMMFGNYRRVVLLTQTSAAKVIERARAASQRLGLPLEIVTTGYGGLEPVVLGLTNRAQAEVRQ